MTDVSVIVPVYNVEKYICKSVNSILMQTHKNIEIILVDDGSRDSSGKICDEIAKQDTRVKVIHKQNEGTGFARNSGMDAAEGEYLYFCDPDDFLEPNLIEDNYTAAKQHDADIVEFGFKTVWKKENGAAADRELTNVPKLCGVYERDNYWNNLRTAGIAGMVWNRMFKRSFIQEHKIRHTSLSNGQDTYFVYDVYSCPFNRIVFNQGVYYSYIKRRGASTTIFKPQRTENEYRISCRYEEMIKGIPCYDGKYDDLIFAKYLWVLSTTLNNLAMAGKSLSYGEKARALKKAVQLEKTEHTIKNVSLKSLKSLGTRLMVIMIRCKMFKAAVMMKEMKFRLKDDVK